MNKSNIFKVVIASTSLICASSVYADNQTNALGNIQLADRYTDQNDNVNNKNRFSDDAITLKAKTKIFEEKIFGDQPISAFTVSVETKDGVVHLTGTVDNKEQINNVVKVVKSVKGVKSVENEVKIENSN